MDLVEASWQGHQLGVRHPWERARLSVVRHLIASHTQLRAGDVVIDIGCGDAFVVEALGRAYPDVRFCAVDSAFSRDLIERYRSRLGTPNVALFSSLDEVPEKTVALVLLMDVIEHVPDDIGFLTDVCSRPWFDRRTEVLMTMPSYPGFFGAHDRFLGHYRRYSRRMVGDLLAAAHLSPRRRGHFFGSLLPARGLQVLRERVLGPPESSRTVTSWRGGEPTARLITALLTFDARAMLFLGGMGLDLPGLSTFAICRKSA